MYKVRLQQANLSEPSISLRWENSKVAVSRELSNYSIGLSFQELSD